MPKNVTESSIERKIVRLCGSLGLYCRKFSSPAHRGVPDRVIGKNGVVLFLEIKRPGEKPTALQQHEIALLRAKGLQAEWVDSYPRAEELIRGIFDRSFI